ncbi:hypothetical protein ABPG72_022088 [Tetrahymena utriculariae]
MNSNQSHNTEQATALSSEQQQVNQQLHQIYQIIPEKPTSAKVEGYDFNKGLDFDKLFESYHTFGLQSTNLAQAIEEVKKMIFWRLSDEEINPERDTDEHLEEEVRKNTRCTIFLGYTSNMISCGMREIIRFLVQHKMVDCIVTTAGGVEEDFIKCMSDFHLGDFHANDIEMRKKALNRIGNIVVPSENYCKLEDWLIPIFFEMYEEQKKNGEIWSPSKVIRKLGEKINNEESVYYWAYKNNIPVFCPAIVDGAIGDMLYYFSYKVDGFILDLVQDVRELNKIVLKSKKTGALVLGGGLVKHHIMNANIWRNGADFGVFINTGLIYDGSDAGARISEAVSWGKMQVQSSYVKVFSEASLVFPILVAQTFYKYKEQASKLNVRVNDEERKQTKSQIDLKEKSNHIKKFE